MPEPPGSTYRLQLHAGFGFADVAAQAGYLASLGVTHVYLSPVLQAAPGSAHGYDIVDHSVISAELGGEDGFRAMAAVLRRRGLGIIVDVVPNHMGIAAPEVLRRQFWSVLADGPQSACAHWFDIDWAARGGRLLLPILAGPVSECAADIRVDHAGDARQPGGERGPVLRYFEHVLPLRPGTAELPLERLLAAQHYELADWRTASAELNWRRFFDITTLIGVQVQEADVFAATHGLVLGLVAEGLVDGLRIDHPDGLADPRGYLRRLATATSGAWVVTEKILARGERLPADWECAGTTGYDSMAVIGGLFTDPAGAGELTTAYVRFTGGSAAFGPVAAAARREVAGNTLAAEIERLVRAAARCGDPVLDAASPGGVRAVLAELVSAVGVYRAYVVPGEPPPPASVTIVQAAAREVRDRVPGGLHEVLDAVAGLVLEPVAVSGEAGGGSGGAGSGGAGSTGAAAARAELAVRFQQTCGPVMAKGVEDTAFYRWSALVAQNDVGMEPGSRPATPADFHAFAARLARDWPATMTTLSTHDTKRGEDLRARLTVLAERPAEWADEVARWHALAAGVGRGALPEPDTEYLLWQTLAGAWPIEPGRLSQYLCKAMREAKTRTSWLRPDSGYEAAVLELAEAVLADSELSGRIAAFVAAIEPDALVNSLGAKLIQLTMPGVPDVYQGCELGSFSLVDPDNRRPVDFARRRELLDLLDNTVPGEGGSGEGGPGEGGPGEGGPGDGGPGALGGSALDWQKLLVTSRALRVRRDHPDWFAGRYEPLTAEGPAAGHVVAFARGGHAVTVATRLPVGLRQRGGWSGTVLRLPAGPEYRAWRDVLTETVHAGPQLRLDRLTERLPVVLLVPDPVARRPDQVF